MKVRWRFVFLVAVFLGLTTSNGFASATNIYVAQNPVGSANGVDCADAYGVNFFNASGDWGAGGGQIGPGTTVHLCGTFTGSPGSTMLTVQDSGANGSPITIKFESGATLTAPYWSGSSGAIDLNSQSYIVVDGGTNGKIENTQNGTTLTYQHNSMGVVAGGTFNCEIKNLTVANLYIHSSTSDTSVSNIIAVYAYPPSTNLIIGNDTLHNCATCIAVYGNTTRIHDNDIYNFSTGIQWGANGATYSNMSIYNNHFHDMGAWDTSSNSYHHEAIHAWGQSGGICSGLEIYNNTFDGNPGFNVTAWVFLEDNISNARVYNNVFIWPSTAPHVSNSGQLAFRGRSGDSNVDSNAAYNNVIIGNAPTAGGAVGMEVFYNTNFSLRNNIFLGENTAINMANSTVSQITNNVYEDVMTEFGSGNTFMWDGASTASLAKWQSECSCDSGSLLDTAAQINIDPDGQPQSGSVAIGMGTNLTGLKIAGLDKDKIGVQRPSSGPWDAGAYVYGSNTSSGPAPPSGLTAAAN